MGSDLQNLNLKHLMRPKLELQEINKKNASFASLIPIILLLNRFLNTEPGNKRLPRQRL